jgi:hypothetical protein
MGRSMLDGESDGMLDGDSDGIHDGALEETAPRALNSKKRAGQ